MRLAPGRFSVSTKPMAMGSAPISKTMGIVVLADFAASAAGAPPGATITVTGRPAKSAASAGNLLCWPSAQRNSIATFRPSTYPVSPRPCAEGSYTAGEHGRRFSAKISDHRHRHRLLGARHERPCCGRATENTENFAAPHVRPWAWTKHRIGSSEDFIIDLWTSRCPK